MTFAGLQLEGLSWGHGASALGGPLSLELATGASLAVVGPNGVGKSTLLRTIAGLQQPMAGTVRLSGTALPGLAAVARAREVAVLSQGAQVDPELTVRELVELGRTPHLGAFGRLRAEDRVAVEQALLSCDLELLASRPLGRLSGGELQRARLALALAQRAPLLLLDEPASHLDLRRRAELFALLARLRKERALVLVLVLHELAEAYREADRVLVLTPTSSRELLQDDPRRREVLAEAFGVDAERIVLG